MDIHLTLEGKKGTKHATVNLKVETTMAHIDDIHKDSKQIIGGLFINCGQSGTKQSSKIIHQKIGE